MIGLLCPCGNSFARPAAVVKRGGGKYCSNRCTARFTRGSYDEQFWRKVDKSEGLGPQGTCWEWRGTLIKGYGSFSRKGTHRISWEKANGAILEGLCVLHRCDNPPCVNPEHLFLGTRADNNMDRLLKWRTSPQGAMPLTEELVRQIRAEHAVGVPHKVIGAAFRRTPNSIADIVHRRRYAYVL